MGDSVVERRVWKGGQGDGSSLALNGGAEEWWFPWIWE